MNVILDLFVVFVICAIGITLSIYSLKEDKNKVWAIIGLLLFVPTLCISTYGMLTQDVNVAIVQHK